MRNKSKTGWLLAALVFLAFLTPAGVTADQPSPKLDRAYKMYIRFCHSDRPWDSIHFAKDMARLSEQEFGPDHITTAGLHVYLAENHRKLGQDEEAEALFQRWLPALEKLVLAEERPKWNTIGELHEFLFSYGWLLRDKGHVDESERVIARSNEMKKRFMDYPEYSDRFWNGCGYGRWWFKMK